MTDIEVGKNPVPLDIALEVKKLIDILGKRYEFTNGETAAYWNLCFTVTQNLGKVKTNHE